ncbi:VWA domain-containing protein [Bryobacter aggregatus]|uniref:VWA domain-containing protein n=1 Tax=Bryobacter aggregatus TaxID=360054 RepID=UPI0004E1DCCA|nr:VWA domain-containing protein [Bryobacter aggregatus]
MPRTVCSVSALAALAFSLSPILTPALNAYQDPPVVFKSDVSLVRVDVQVADRSNRSISALHREDFQLREGGQVREIVNFARENLPLDLVLLLDVSGSMRPHVERIAEAARQALLQLGNEDRVAILVFDRSTRVSMSFKSNHDEIMRGFQQLLDRENFNGGTDITRGMLDATDYMRKHARRDARRAVVILTDDMTERDRDEYRVERALEEAGTVMSALIAPDAMGNRAQTPGTFPGRGRSRGGGGGWPSGGGGGLGGIIFGGGGYPGGGGGRRMPGGNGPVTMGNGRLKSAGTSEIARASGGDSMPVDDASALETTLERIRQSYALYFNAPEGVKQGEQRNVEIALAGAVVRRYPDAELRYRQTYIVTEGGTTNGPGAGNDTPTVTHRNPSTDSGSIFEPVNSSTSTSEAPRMKRRPAVDDPSSAGGWRKADNTPAEKPADTVAAPANPVPVAPAADDKTDADPKTSGGFRKLKPGEKP